MSETNGDAQKELKSMGFETFVSHTILRNCDNTKMWGSQKNFQTQCALNDNQCPKKITGVSDVLGSHQWDQTNKDQLKRKKKEKKIDNKTMAIRKQTQKMNLVHHLHNNTRMSFATTVARKGISLITAGL